MLNYRKVKETKNYILYVNDYSYLYETVFVVFNKKTSKFIKGTMSKQIYTLLLDLFKFKEKYLKQR